MRTNIIFVATESFHIEILIDHIINAGFQYDQNVLENEIIQNGDTLKSFVSFKTKKSAMAALKLAEMWLRSNFKNVHFNPSKDSLFIGSSVAFVSKYYRV